MVSIFMYINLDLIGIMIALFGCFVKISNCKRKIMDQNYSSDYVTLKVYWRKMVKHMPLLVSSN